MRSKPARQAVFEVLAAVALRYGGLEAVTGALAAALSKHEHLAAALAELAAYAEGKFSDSRLVRWTVAWPQPAGSSEHALGLTLRTCCCCYRYLRLLLATMRCTRALGGSAVLHQTHTESLVHHFSLVSTALAKLGASQRRTISAPAA